MGDIKWSATRTDIANYCRMRYWLRYVEHAPTSRLSVFPKGSLLHNLIEHFWDRLGTEEQIYTKGGNKRNIPQKYFDKDSFSNYSTGKWMSEVYNDQQVRKKIENGELHGSNLRKAEKNLIAWKTPQEPYEMKYQIRDITKTLYDHFMEEGPPLYSELKFDFVLRDLYFPDNAKNIFDMHFSGFIDEIRLRDGKVVVRDYKSGKPWVDEMKVRHDPQLTLYNIGLCSLVLRNDEMAEKLGLEERRKEYMGNPLFIDPEFIEEFFMMEAPLVAERMVAKNPNTDKKRLPLAINSTKRTDEHFFEIVRMIKGTEESIEKGVVYPERGRKCDYCDMQVACESKLKDASPDSEPMQSDGQGLFDFAALTYEKKLVVKEGRDPITISGPIKVFKGNEEMPTQKKFNFGRKTSY